MSSQVVPLAMHTLLAAVPPLLETLLNRIYWNGIQLGRRVLHNHDSNRVRFSGISSPGEWLDHRTETC